MPSYQESLETLLNSISVAPLNATWFYHTPPPPPPQAGAASPDAAAASVPAPQYHACVRVPVGQSFVSMEILFNSEDLDLPFDIIWVGKDNHGVPPTAIADYSWLDLGRCPSLTEWPCDGKPSRLRDALLEVVDQYTEGERTRFGAVANERIAYEFATFLNAFPTLNCSVEEYPAAPGAGDGLFVRCGASIPLNTCIAAMFPGLALRYIVLMDSNGSYSSCLISRAYLECPADALAALALTQPKQFDGQDPLCVFIPQLEEDINRRVQEVMRRESIINCMARIIGDPLESYTTGPATASFAYQHDNVLRDLALLGDVAGASPGSPNAAADECPEMCVLIMDFKGQSLPAVTLISAHHMMPNGLAPVSVKIQYDCEAMAHASVVAREVLTGVATSYRRFMDAAKVWNDKKE